MEFEKTAPRATTVKKKTLDFSKLKGSDFVRNLVEFSLLRNSPFVSHMSDSMRRGDTFPSWATRESERLPRHITEDSVVNNEIFYSKYSSFKKYDKKSVLIIGGGPSTSKLDFSKVDRDFTWSVNHFYLNPVINKLKIDMAMMMGEPDIKSKEFLDYRERFKPMIGLEVHDRWDNYEFDDYDNYFLMHTDFYSKLGAGVRMMIFACCLGASKVSFVGMDGPKYIKKGEHAFEKNKKTLPSGFSEELYKWHYGLFWDYINRSFPNIKFENLGYGEEYHSSGLLGLTSKVKIIQKEA